MGGSSPTIHSRDKPLVMTSASYHDNQAVDEVTEQDDHLLDDRLLQVLGWLTLQRQKIRSFNGGQP